MIILIVVFMLVLAPLVPMLIMATKQWFRDVWEAIKS